MGTTADLAVSGPKRCSVLLHRLISLAFIPATLCACVTVHIESAGVPVHVVRHVGLLKVEVATAQSAVVGDVSGVGIVGTPMGWSAGYTRQRWAAMGPECRAVLWTDAAQPDAAVRGMLSAAAGACEVRGSPSSADPATAKPVPDTTSAIHHQEEEP